MTLSSAQAFVAVELTAGAYDGADFVFGAYAGAAGGFGAPVTTDPAGTAHGSDYLVDWVEFTFPAEPAALVGLPHTESECLPWLRRPRCHAQRRRKRTHARTAHFATPDWAAAAPGRPASPARVNDDGCAAHLTSNP